MMSDFKEPPNDADGASVHRVVHTPGPWTIEPHGKGFALYSGRDDHHHGMNLVYLTEPDWNWKANAKLIEDAPRLLEVLRSLADLQNGCPLSKYKKEWEETMRQAYELLEKHGG